MPHAGAAKAASLRHFSFTSLDTPYGQLKLEVDYAPGAAINFLEQSATPGHQPEIIPDYVRGAQPADRRHSTDAAPRGGLTASLQGSRRPQSLLNPGAAGFFQTLPATCYRLQCWRLLQSLMKICHAWQKWHIYQWHLVRLKLIANSSRVWCSSEAVSCCSQQA